MTEASRNFEKYGISKPYRLELPIVSRLRTAVQDKGLIQGITHMFLVAGISVRVVGNPAPWTRQAQGVIFIGDHRQGIEQAPFLAMLGQNGREDVHCMAKPFSMQARILATLGIEPAMMIPVIPGTLAKDRPNKLNRDFYWRLMSRGNLPTAEEIKGINATSLQVSADVVTAGRCMVLFPAGGVMDAAKRPWQHGVGKIIKLLAPEAQRRVIIVPFRFDTFSRWRLLRALYSVKKSPPQTLTVRIGRQGSVGSLLGSASRIEASTAREITDTLRAQFVAAFGK